MKWIDSFSDFAYDQIKCDTPLGEFIIEWKSWKENPSYDLSLEGNWIAYEYNLDLLKEKAEDYLLNLKDKLDEFCRENINK